MCGTVRHCAGAGAQRGLHPPQHPVPRPPHVSAGREGEGDTHQHYHHHHHTTTTTIPPHLYERAQSMARHVRMRSSCNAHAPHLRCPQCVSHMCHMCVTWQHTCRCIPMPRFPPKSFMVEPWVEGEEVWVVPPSAPGGTPTVTCSGGFRGLEAWRFQGFWMSSVWGFRV